METVEHMQETQEFQKISEDKDPLKRGRRDFRVGIFGNDFVLSRWPEVDRILYEVFEQSSFNDNFKRTRPAAHTWQMIHQPYQYGLKHIVALDLDDEILGAFFVIPTYQPPGKEDCDLGWMFTVELYPRFRHEVLNAIIDKVHEVTKAAGFKRIVTEMGTEAGAKFLAKKHGYVHTPMGEKVNRWTKVLY